jgi:hypothetical protein
MGLLMMKDYLILGGETGSLKMNLLCSSLKSPDLDLFLTLLLRISTSSLY